MLFPQAHTLQLACTCEYVIPGKVHSDGRRYLPTVVFALTTRSDCATPEGFRLGIVDRHHRLLSDAVGRTGQARVVCALSAIQIQQPPYQKGFLPEAGQTGDISLSPQIAAQVQQVLTWEVETEYLPYQALYTELLIDVGHGVIGLRTNVTAASITAALGVEQLAAGDWIRLERSRIDLLAFTATPVPT